MESKKFNPLSSRLPQIKKVHQVIGYSIYFLTKAQVLIGIWIYDYIELLYLNLFIFLIMFYSA